MHSKLDLDFYSRPSPIVAQELLGKTLVFETHHGTITETEAYGGSDDPASHAFKGPTKRAAIMFGPPGYGYIYLIYGIHYCLNIVTDQDTTPSAVLIRGLLINGRTLNGPGRVCRSLGITTAQNGISLLTTPHFYVQDELSPVHYEKNPRIGIKKGQDKLWRFNMTSFSIAPYRETI